MLKDSESKPIEERDDFMLNEPSRIGLVYFSDQKWTLTHFDQLPIVLWFE